MRLFELITYGKPYLNYFAAACERRDSTSHAQLKRELLDDRYGEATLPRLTGKGWWVARPVEAPTTSHKITGRTLPFLSLNQGSHTWGVIL